MAFDIQASWDLACYPQTMTLLEPTSAAVNLLSGYVAHKLTGFSSAPTISPSEYATVLKSALDTASPGGRTYTVTWSSNGYTISVDSGTFQLTFTGDNGTNAKNALGFAGDTGTAASHVATNAPWFYLEDSKACMDVSHVGRREYEPSNLYSGSYSAGGAAYAVTGKGGVLFKDYRIQYIDVSKVYTSDASGGYTFQEFWKTARVAPFVHSEGADTATYLLRPAESGSFSPTFWNAKQLTTKFDIDFKTYFYE